MKNTSTKTIRVLVAEDRRPQATHLASLLRSSAGFDVVGAVASGREAVAAAQRLRPQLIAIDLHLPAIGSYEATRQIMESCPTPIVLVSGCGDAAGQLGAGLAAGAVAVVDWPGATDPEARAYEQAALLTTLRLMSDVRVVTRRASRPARPAAGTPTLHSAPQVLAVAASTGGPAALQMLLCGLGARFPLPILIAQHIARGFEAALAEWLNTTVPLPVRVGQQGEWLLPGQVYLAPADHHLGLSVPGRLLLRPAAAGDRFCPSADLLFESIATNYAAAAIGVILTGMGDDGTRGLLALRAAGAPTLGQSAQSCVVYGMPRAAFEAGAIGRVEPLTALAPAIVELAGGSLSAGGQHAR